MRICSLSINVTDDNIEVERLSDDLFVIQAQKDPAAPYASIFGDRDIMRRLQVAIGEVLDGRQTCEIPAAHAPAA